MGWNEWTNAKKGGVVGGSIAAGILVIGAGVGIGVAFSKPKQEIDLWVPWADTTTQYKALDQIIELYNEIGESDYEFNVYTAGAGGYKESGFVETSNLLLNNINHTKKLPDMVINNQDALAILANSGKTDLTVNLEAEGLETENLYLDQQDKVAGVDATADGDIMAIRFYSTQNMGIDIPLMNWFVANSGGKITVDASSNIGTAMAAVTLTEEDTATIEKNYKAKAAGITSYNITDATFESQTELHKFADAILDNFNMLDSDGKVIKNPGKDKGRGVIAYTNPQTEFLTATQAHLDGVDSTEQMIDITDKGNHYSFLTEAAQYEAAGLVWDDYKVGMESGAYWMAGNTGMYSSAQVSGHLAPVTIGSTSGTSFNTKPVTGTDQNGNPVDQSGFLNPEEIYYVNAYSTFDGTGEAVYKSQGPSLMAIDRGMKDQEERTDAMIDFMNWLISGEKVATFDGDGNITSGDEMTAGTAFSIVSDFLLNSKGAVDYVATAGYSDAVEPGLDLTYKTMTDDDKNTKLLAEPNDANTGAFWNIVKGEINSEMTAYTESADGSYEIADWNSASQNIVKEVNKGNLDANGQITVPAARKEISNLAVLANNRR